MEVWRDEDNNLYLKGQGELHWALANHCPHYQTKPGAARGMETEAAITSI